MGPAGRSITGYRGRRSGTLLLQMSCRPLLAGASPRVETTGQVDGGSRQIGDTTASTALIMLARQSGTALDVLIRTTTEGPPAFPRATPRPKMRACRCSALGPSSTSSSPSSHVRPSSLRLQRPDGIDKRENRLPPTAGSHCSPPP